MLIISSYFGIKKPPLSGRFVSLVATKHPYLVVVVVVVVVTRSMYLVSTFASQNAIRFSQVLLRALYQYASIEK